jgi:hypothetical protein
MLLLSRVDVGSTTLHVRQNRGIMVWIMSTLSGFTSQLCQHPTLQQNHLQPVGKTASKKQRAQSGK